MNENISNANGSNMNNGSTAATAATATNPTVQLLKREYPVLIPYQIDFQTRTIGKHISLTKRFCVWRFGFAHVPSLLSGKRGVANRGIEFEVKFIWSVASGKHELHMNNICISSSSNNFHNYSSSVSNMHTSTPQRSTNKFDQTFNIPTSILPGGHILHITLWNIHINSFHSHNSNNNHNHHSNDDINRMYILRLDGQEYSEFAKIYELGNKNMMNKYQHALQKIVHNSNNNNNTSNTSNVSNVSNVSNSHNVNNNNNHNNNNNSTTGTNTSNQSHQKNNEHSDVDTLVRGRPRYQPNNNNNGIHTHTTHRNRVRSHTADNAILSNEHINSSINSSSNNNSTQLHHQHRIPQQQRQQHQQDRNYRYNDRNVQPPALNTSASDDVDYYYERQRPIMGMAETKNNTRHGYNHNNGGWKNYLHNLNRRDYATNEHEEKEHVAKAKVNSFRDLRGDNIHNQSSYDINNNTQRYQQQQHHHHQYTQYDYSGSGGGSGVPSKNTYGSNSHNSEVVETLSIPTFARPPKASPPRKNIIKVHSRSASPRHNNSNSNNNIHQRVVNNNNNNNNNISTQQQQQQQHQHPVRATNSIPDLLDDNSKRMNIHNTTTTPRNSPGPSLGTGLKRGGGLQTSISVPNLIVRSTSDITLDTMLRDIGKDSDGMSVVTKGYAHLDPTQMSTTQKHINFRLQNPPVYADSSAGDLIQAQPKPVPAPMSQRQPPAAPVPSAPPAPMMYNGSFTNQSTNANGSNSSNVGNANSNAYQPMNLAQQQQWINQQNPPSHPKQQQQSHQSYNAMNFAGRHMHVPMQQNQPQAAGAAVEGFVPPPAPTWDSLQNAFSNSAQSNNSNSQQHSNQYQSGFQQQNKQQNHQTIVRQLDPLST